VSREDGAGAPWAGEQGGVRDRVHDAYLSLKDT
jgi:hypothetical protein